MITNKIVSMISIAMLCLFGLKPAVAQDTAFTPTHKVTIEDQTICSDDNGYYSVRGIVLIDSFMRSQYADSVEIISVHAQGDPMTIPAYWNGCFYHTNVAATAWPQVMIDRKVAENSNNVIPLYQQHADDFAVADVNVSVEYDTATRALDVTGEAHFAVAVTPGLGHYNLALVVTEDSVHHPADTLYAQRNAYSGGNLGPMAGAGIDFTAQPDPVPAGVMYYRNVARMISAFKGNDGSLPDTIAESSTHSYTFATYTIPAGFNPEKMRAIVLLIDTVSGEVKNANGAPVVAKFPTGIKKAASAFGFKVYPNPISNESTISFSLNQPKSIALQVTNVAGKTVLFVERTSFAAGQHTLTLNRKNLSSGVYFVTLHGGKDSVTSKVIVE